MRLGLKALGRSGLTHAVRPVFGGLGAILMFHHVGARAAGGFGGNDHLAVKPEFLFELLSELRQEAVDIVSLDEAVSRLQAARSGRPSVHPFVAVTFDDGYRDNIETAYPILRSLRVPFTLFVCSGFVDRTVAIWWLSLERIIETQNTIGLEVGGKRHVLHCVGVREKRRAFSQAVRLLRGVSNEELHAAMAHLAHETGHDAIALADEKMATWPMLRELGGDPLATLGAHTRSHPFLPKLASADAKREMLESCGRIEEMTGIRPEFFAYPYGFEDAVGSREAALASEAGFKAALTTRKGFVWKEHADHPWALPRVSINGHYQNMAAMRALLSGFPFYVANGFNRVKTL